uniref:Growth arrest-specific protein 8 domain-containing protein n=1 Tax=Alexandrium monilatum TaxID=311494 RepID=A0A7S4TAX6_9DINO|mmetsp:Transcript_42378/g.132090  ORF Transcript_42378/g.132090 Transcript_42378/m.132090 type:complete len:464 (-) Transcript_42378:36-1427(-)
MGKKGKKKKNVDPAALAEQAAQEAQEKKRFEMQKEAKRLRERCDREERDFHNFLMEREKINYFWIVEKKTLNEKMADLRNKEREYQDLEERQQIELKMFQQRLKHLRYHQQDEVVELKTDGELALKLQEDHHRVTEAEIRKDKRALKVETKEAEVAQDDFIRMLKLEQDQKVLELRQEFDRRARDMQQKYELRMKVIRDDMEKQQRKQVQRIEEAKNSQIQRVMAKNQKDFLEIKVYYSEITTSNLDLIKRLKEEFSEIKKRENDDAKKMFDLEQRNRQLKEPLTRAKQDVENLQIQLVAYQKDKERLAEVKDKIKQSETQLHRMEFQHEVLQQQSATVNKERDRLYEQFQHSIYDVQQKAGLKNLILEKKIDAIEEALETTEAQVSELVASASNDQTQVAGGISQKLDEVIAYKNDIVAQLEEEVQRIKDSHTTMVRTYESKLAEYGIPPEELGFVPAVAAA